MNFLDGTNNYDMNSTFSSERLVQITEGDICRFFSNWLYGHDNNPTEADQASVRSTTINYYKKAISSFMPRQNMPWDKIRKEGNPTRSQDVNRLIKILKKKEVRGQGISSKARRPFEYREFINILESVRREEANILRRHRTIAIQCIQWTLIARIDDSMHLQFDNFSMSPQFNFVLYCRMTWSKNVLDEREAPPQIILGSMNEIQCPLLQLSIYLELLGNAHCSLGERQNLFCDGSIKAGISSYRASLKAVCSSGSFNKLKEGLLGTHSTRKGPSTYAGRCGKPKHFVDLRGRWRNKRRQVDTYCEN